MSDKQCGKKPDTVWRRLGYPANVKVLARLPRTESFDDRKRTTKSKPVNYLKMMKEYNKAHEEVCKQVESLKSKLGLVELPTKMFINGSKYTGQWNVNGMNGFGEFEFENGVIFTGNFKDNQFHGQGLYKYANGIQVEAKHDNGYTIYRNVICTDGTRISDTDKIFASSDRRFAREMTEGLKPTDKENLTPTANPHKLNHKEYDCGYGIVHADYHFVTPYEEGCGCRALLTQDEHKWILKNCRTSELGPLSYTCGLYPEPDKWPMPILEHIESTPEKIVTYDFQDELAEQKVKGMTPSPPNHRARFESFDNHDTDDLGINVKVTTRVFDKKLDKARNTNNTERSDTALGINKARLKEKLKKKYPCCATRKALLKQLLEKIHREEQDL